MLDQAHVSGPALPSRFAAEKVRKLLQRLCVSILGCHSQLSILEMCQRDCLKMIFILLHSCWQAITNFWLKKKDPTTDFFFKVVKQMLVPEQMTSSSRLHKVYDDSTQMYILCKVL